MQEAVNKNPDNATYRFHLAAVLSGQGKKEQAKAEMGKALRLNSKLGDRDEVKQLMGELSL